MAIYYILKLNGKWKELMWYKDTVEHFLNTFPPLKSEWEGK